MSMPSFSRLRVQSFLSDAGRKVGRYNKQIQRAFMYFNIRIKFHDSILQFSSRLSTSLRGGSRLSYYAEGVFTYIFIISLLSTSIGISPDGGNKKPAGQRRVNSFTTD